MLVLTGHYDTKGNPCIRLPLEGIFGRSTEKLGLRPEALIDTGFTGFISMPMEHAFLLALPLSCWTSSTLADGSTHDKLAASVHVKLVGKATWGEAILEPHSSEYLVGLEFLRTFHLALVLTEKEVLLFNDDPEWPQELSEMKEGRAVRERRVPYRLADWLQ
jgi:predicted aspartyl protease